MAIPQKIKYAPSVVVVNKRKVIEYLDVNSDDDLELMNVYLNVYKTNYRSIFCYKKAGFVTLETGKTDEDIHMIYNIR